MKLLSIFLLLAFIRPTHAGWFGPNNYEDCILENMKGVSQLQVMWTIKNACRAKFPQACYAWRKTMSQYKKGETYQGYRFKGGNPADYKNWERYNVFDKFDEAMGRKRSADIHFSDESPAASNQPPEGCDIAIAK